MRASLLACAAAANGVLAPQIGLRLELVYTSIMIQAMDIREAMKQEPFQPFQVCMADGQTFGVPHPEFVAVEPVGRTCVVWSPNGFPQLISIALVARLNFDPPDIGPASESSAA